MTSPISQRGYTTQELLREGRTLVGMVDHLEEVGKLVPEGPRQEALVHAIKYLYAAGKYLELASKAADEELEEARRG
jgi:hypothetical protein